MHDFATDERSLEPETELQALADSLAQSMAQAWQRGERPVVETLFAEHPELADDPELAVQLIYEEITLRRDFMFEPTEAEILARFPRWRNELSVLLACDRLVQPCDLVTSSPGTRVPQRWPEVGTRLGQFRLVAILGSGTMGRTFLARDPDLADRHVVLKLTARGLGEHVSLARLQHTNVVPLYAAPEFPEQDLRALCMPYLGGTTLDSVFAQIRLHVEGRPTGKSIIDAIDRAEAQLPVREELRKQGTARLVLEELSYADSIAWIASQLAHALAAAHDGGLVHMDVKAANVLIATDGTPMLLDFHLAREPVKVDSLPPTWVGGTPHAMPPEQRAAMAAVKDHRPVTVAVDGRADIYALGRLMEEAFAVPRGQERVTPGLHAIIDRCVENDPADRYLNARALAEDLERHLNDELLVGVRNHSLPERWSKWRRRRPYGLAWSIGLLALAAGAYLGAGFVNNRLASAQDAVLSARVQLNMRNYEDAVQIAKRGLSQVEYWPLATRTRRELQAVLDSVKEVHSARELHSLVEQLRFLVGAESPRSGERELTRPLKVRELWDQYSVLASEGHLVPERELSSLIVEDLRDLVTLGSNFNARLAQTTAAKNDALEEAKTLQSEAEEVLGAAPEDSPATFCNIGLKRLQESDYSTAILAFERALELQPNHFWSNFYHAIASYRLKHYQTALGDFQTCIALAPKSPECFYNRALVFTELDQKDRAMRDYDHAIKLKPDFFNAALNLGLLHYNLKQYERAKAMLLKALALRPTDDQANYFMAQVYLTEGDHSRALACLDKARSIPKAAELRTRLLNDARNLRR